MKMKWKCHIPRYIPRYVPLKLMKMKMEMTMIDQRERERERLKPVYFHSHDLLFFLADDDISIIQRGQNMLNFVEIFSFVLTVLLPARKTQ